MTSLEGLLLAAWQFLPAWLANAAPLAISGFVPHALRVPLDFGIKAGDGNRLLGDGKTVLGFFVGIVAGGIIGLLQGNAVLGALLGFGAMAGDSAGSFVRRRMGLPRGTDVLILNQLDFVAGALLFSSLARSWGVIEMAAICVLTIPMHRLTNLIAYKAGIKGEPW